MDDQSLSHTKWKDVYKRQRGNRFYRYTALPNQVKRYTILSEQLQQTGDQEYANNEDHYQAFVYDTYLDMPDATRNLLRNRLGDYDCLLYTSRCV